MPFNRCGTLLSNIVNGGNNSGELGATSGITRLWPVAAAVGGTAAVAYAAAVAARVLI